MDEAFDKIKLETRHFAKRQFTWFRRERDVTWIDKDRFADEQELLKHCVREIRQHFDRTHGSLCAGDQTAF